MLDQQLCAMFDQKYAVGPTTLDDVVCPTVPDGLDHQFWTNLLNLFKRPLKLYDFRLAIHFFFQETNLMVYSSSFPKLV